VDDSNVFFLFSRLRCSRVTPCPCARDRCGIMAHAPVQRALTAIRCRASDAVVHVLKKNPKTGRADRRIRGSRGDDRPAVRRPVPHESLCRLVSPARILSVDPKNYRLLHCRTKARGARTPAALSVGGARKPRVRCVKSDAGWSALSCCFVVADGARAIPGSAAARTAKSTNNSFLFELPKRRRIAPPQRRWLRQIWLGSVLRGGRHIVVAARPQPSRTENSRVPLLWLMAADDLPDYVHPVLRRPSAGTSRETPFRAVLIGRRSDGGGCCLKTHHQVPTSTTRLGFAGRGCSWSA